MENDYPLFDEAMNDIQLVISSRGWLDGYEPTIQAYVREATRSLTNPSKDRKDQRSDDFLRGLIKAWEAVLTMGQTALDEHAARVEEARRLRAFDGDWDERADLGRPGPL